MLCFTQKLLLVCKGRTLLLALLNWVLKAFIEPKSI
jgi:hypothetical protein